MSDTERHLFAKVLRGWPVSLINDLLHYEAFMPTLFAYQLIGETEKTLNALLRRFRRLRIGATP